MKAGAFTTFVVLLLVLLSVLTWKFFHSPGSDSDSRSRDETSSSYEERLTDPPKTDDSAVSHQRPALDELDSFSTLREELLLQSLSESKVLRDLTLGFGNRGNMERFRKEADRNGIRILGEITGLATLRIQITDLARASKFMDEWGDEISTQYNYRVRQPQAPRSEVIEGEKEFGGQAPDWLGAPVDRENWGRGIKVAVIDSGIDASHPALKGAEVAEISLIKGEAPSPGHGTAVASIIVGNSENQKGIAPAASILSVRVLNKDGEGDSFTVARGIVEAVDRGADVINMSLGGDASSSVLEQAVQYAQSRGVSVVAAVGNEGQEGVAYPARYDGVVGVTSLDANGQSSGFANYGKGVDIGAPGVGVYTAWADEEIVSFSGTSTASAFVAGVLAAELSKNPGVPREKIVDLLYEYANESEKPGFDQYTGHGALNVARIENRSDPYLADAAIVGYYFDPLDFGKPNVPFLVSVQNQGTLWLKNVELEVDYMGLSRKFVISNLNPGEVKSEQLLLDRGKGREGVRIQSRLRVQGRDDLNPENNERASTITLPSN
jgi:thermitase